LCRTVDKSVIGGMRITRGGIPETTHTGKIKQTEAAAAELASKAAAAKEVAKQEVA